MNLVMPKLIKFSKRIIESRELTAETDLCDKDRRKRRKIERKTMITILMIIVLIMANEKKE